MENRQKVLYWRLAVDACTGYQQPHQLNTMSADGRRQGYYLAWFRGRVSKYGQLLQAINFNSAVEFEVRVTPADADCEVVEVAFPLDRSLW